MKPILIQDPKVNELISRQVATMMSNYTFPAGRIGGKQIINFSSHKQVNLFILFQIYQDWSGQINNMVHPYFDFGNVEVKGALKNFQNVLSRHISVNKEDFKPLLEKAVYNTLRLIVDPVSSLQKFYFKSADHVTLALFQKHASYFSDFDFAIQSIAKFYEKNRVSAVEKDDFFQKFDKIIGIFEKKEEVEIRSYQEKLFFQAFGEKLELYLPVEPKVNLDQRSSKFQREPNTPTYESPRQDPKPKYHRPPGINESLKQETSQKEKTVLETHRPVEKPVIEVPKVDPVVERNVPEIEVSPSPPDRVQPKVEEALPISKPVSEVMPPAQEKSVADEIVSPEVQTEHPSAPIDLFSSPEEKSRPIIGQDSKQTTLADRLKHSSGGSSVLQNISSGSGGNTGNKKLAETIPVHKQFQFVQKLFGGSSVKFKVVLEKLEGTSNFGEAESILNRYVFNNPDVNRDTKLAQELVDLVKDQY